MGEMPELRSCRSILKKILAPRYDLVAQKILPENDEDSL